MIYPKNTYKINDTILRIHPKNTYIMILSYKYIYNEWYYPKNTHIMNDTILRIHI